MKEADFVASAYSVALGVGKFIKKNTEHVLDEEAVVATMIANHQIAHAIPKKRHDEYETLVRDIYREKVRVLLS